MPLTTASQEHHLYDLVATRDGFRVSPTCADGHVLVMELIERLGLLDRMEPHAGRSGSVDRGFMLGRTSSAILLPVPTVTQADSPRVWPASHAAAPAPMPTPTPPPVVPPATPGTNTVPISEPAPFPLPAMPALRQEEANHSGQPAVPPTGKRLSEMVALNLANLARGPKKATPATRDRRYILDLFLDYECLALEHCMLDHLKIVGDRRKVDAAHSSAPTLNPRSAAASRADLRALLDEAGHGLGHMADHIGTYERKLLAELNLVIFQWPNPPTLDQLSRIPVRIRPDDPRLPPHPSSGEAGAAQLDS